MTSTHGLTDDAPESAIPVTPLTSEAFDDWFAAQGDATRAWIDANAFDASPGTTCLVPGDDGRIGRVLVGVSDTPDVFALGALPSSVPEGTYALDASWDAERKTGAVLGWGLGAYAFTRYRDRKRAPAVLAMPEGVDADRVRATLDAVTLTRDLVNTPAADMMPANLAAAAERLASRHGAYLTVIEDEALITEGFPVVHAVGRASVHRPALIDLTWGDEHHPKVTLVGKGVCFDSGGLDIKPAAGMRYMKKDMGGAAHVLGIASLVMSTKLPVRLRVLVPAVENAISANAFRPGDVLRARNGKTIEIDNTDAEGRLIMSDALVAACEEEPELLIDFATLTGAARVALGTDLPAMFATHDDVAAGISEAAGRTDDPVWRMPLHRPYRKMLDSTIADIVNAASVPVGGAITAGLFLQDFVTDGTPWVHFDVMAYNRTSSPGRPEGGEAMGVRAVFDYLAKRYG